MKDEKDKQESAAAAALALELELASNRLKRLRQKARLRQIRVISTVALVL